MSHLATVPRYRDILDKTTSQLVAVGIEDARLEAQILLGHAAGISRSSVLARLGDPAPAAISQQLLLVLERRLRREPLAYIVGYREFYGREFLVSPAVLIPRPETELIVDDVLPWLRSTEETLVVDVGTGSGALGLTLLAESRGTTLAATDISPGALEIAIKNAERLAVADRADFVLGDLTSMLNRSRRRTLVVANLPYVATSDSDSLQPEVRDWEPQSALFSGPDGLSLIERLIGDLSRLLARGDRAYLEIGMGQRDAAGEMARQNGARTVAFIEQTSSRDPQEHSARVLRLEF